MTDDERIDLVRRFFAACGSDDPKAYVQAYRGFLSADCVYQNPGLPDLHGVDAIFDFFTHYCDYNFVKFVVELKGLAVSGNRVFSERIDYHYDADGHMGHAPEISGVMTVEDGKIKHWRDYFDSRELLEHVDLESYRRDNGGVARAK